MSILNDRITLISSLGYFDDCSKKNNMVLNVSKSKCLIICSRHELQIIDHDVKLNVGDILLEYVKKFCYLGNYLHREMTLSLLVLHVKKVVSNKVKAILKFRKIIQQNVPWQFISRQFYPYK